MATPDKIDSLSRASLEPAHIPKAHNITPPSSPTMPRHSHTGATDFLRPGISKIIVPGFATAASLSEISVSGLGPSTQGPLESTAMDDTWPDQNEGVVAAPYLYLHRTPGKGIRTQVIEAINVWMAVPLDRLEIINEFIHMLHTASLLIDDIEDNATLRRGLPVAHNVYGVAQTINSANYFYFKAIQEIQRLGDPDAMEHAVNELLQLHRGQGMDLYWRDSLICPSEDDYLDMIRNKTGGLFRLAIKLMQTQSRKPSTPDWIRLADVFGILFQVRDDYQNLCSQEYTTAKGYCEDLTEGKFSFPVIHSIHCDPTNLDLINVLKQKSSDSDVKQYAVHCMEKTGSFEYTRMFIGQLIMEARGLIDNAGANGGSTEYLHKALDKLSI
ncbi:Polyprenyl synthetase-related protein [Beauveria brongniartii RCEF 3172]|uniref:Polyprenyl synthetase-related protein n=1 Tax=Beauveria brongniartii RCEF 3172 TaxID=1081107 RepID=A0A166VNM4_9HYPO|nr:Polyprenyl synthetase-related protein [Beauveria brongniartii RCEF 3172]